MRQPHRTPSIVLSAAAFTLTLAACLTEHEKAYLPEESPLLGTKAGTSTTCLFNSQCPTGFTCCGGFCKSLSTDDNNCGQCGQACDTDEAPYCYQGQCGCYKTFGSRGGTQVNSCSTGTVCCDLKGSTSVASCTDTDTDTENCGGCVALGDPACGPYGDDCVCSNRCDAANLTCTFPPGCSQGECLDECETDQFCQDQPYP